MGIDRELPAGRVTVLFTDIEGSTRLIDELGEFGYVEALGEHRRLLRSAFAAHGGVEVDTQGDAFFYVFADPVKAVIAATEGQKALGSGPITVRMGLHTGELQLTGEGYAGRELHRAARIAASGHGGQVVVSETTRTLVTSDLTALGEHRLKDFDEPIALFQVGQGRFPPLKTISNTNLPRPASSLVGRTAERREVLGLLRNGARLVTLSGPGGSGKTRLAVEVASELVPAFKAGVFWVGLAALRNPALVTQTVAETLGARRGLSEHIADRQMLLLLDNFEQVVTAAPELSRLLEACPNLRLLVTSRELLRVAGEVDYPVPPLEESEAIELFCERSHLGANETIAELCHRLDDLPLAVELAAARTHVLTPKQIVARLGQRLDLLGGGRGTEARQQTLRATVEWSYDLLAATEKQLFARIAVFAGGCTFDAATTVCDAELDDLQSLVEKSLLRHHGDRFWMLETIREFASERLQYLPYESISERHAQWYLRVATSDGTLDGDLENVRAAIRWAQDHDGELEVDLAGATYHFLSGRGLFREALTYLRHAMKTAEHLSLDQTGLLGGAVYVAIRTGDYTIGSRWAEQNVELARGRGDDSAIAWALVGLGLIVRQQGDYARARTLFLESADLAGRDNDARLLGVVHYNLGEIELIQEHAELARLRFRETLRLAQESSDPGGEAFALVGLSLVALTGGDTEPAATFLDDALRLASSIDAKELMFAVLLGTAQVAAQRGEPVRAARLLGATDALREEMGYTPSPLERNQNAQVASIIGDDANLHIARSEGRNLAFDQSVSYALGEDL